MFFFLVVDKIHLSEDRRTYLFVYILIIVFIDNIFILQDNVATPIRRGEMFNNVVYCKFFAECASNFLENRSIFGKDMDRSWEFTFCPTLYNTYLLLIYRLRSLCIRV